MTVNQVKCPQCGTLVAKPASGSAVCTKCGYGSTGAPLAARTIMRPDGTTGGASGNGPPVLGRLRTVPVGKTVGLGIVTLGIYVLVRSYKMSGDLHRMPGGNRNWQTFFWLQFIPLAGVIFSFMLYFKNNKQSNALRQARGLASSYLPFILLFIPIASIAAPFVWASHYNEVARRS